MFYVVKRIYVFQKSVSGIDHGDVRLWTQISWLVSVGYIIVTATLRRLHY
jgi:hypothetical protein